MNVEFEELQFLGIYGILRETGKLIHKWRRIFTQISLAFVLPISLLIFANMEISNSLIRKISDDQLVLLLTDKSTPKFQKLSDAVSSERVYYLLYSLASSIFSAVFSLPATSAVIYTVACIYTARDDVSFKQVISVLPKVWKRLLVTFLCVMAAFFAFNLAAFFVLFFILLIAVLLYGQNSVTFSASSATILFFFIIVYCVAAWYLTIIWQLSSVVSVLEDSCGFKAMAKSKELLKGKMRMLTKLLMLLGLPFGAAQLAFYYLGFQSPSTGVVGKGILGIIWILSFLLFFLIKLVTETVVYFVCKSYHHESIDKSALSYHLQGYLQTDYVRLKVEDDVEKLQAVI